MKLRDFINESSQDLYRFISTSSCIKDLERGFLLKSDEPQNKSNPDYSEKEDPQYSIKRNKVMPRIYVSRDKNYHLNNLEYGRKNIGALGGTPSYPAIRYTLDIEKIKTKHKVVPFENRMHQFDFPHETKKGIKQSQSRYEAEERILADKLPVSYIKEITILNLMDLDDKKIEKIKELAKKNNIKIIDTRKMK